MSDGAAKPNTEMTQTSARLPARFGDELAAVPEFNARDLLLASAPRRVLEGLRFLLEAHNYAADVGTDLWDFALELRELRSIGLTKFDLRWLAMKGLVEFARETTLPGETQRTFRKSAGISFGKHSCFVISPAGVRAMRDAKSLPQALEPRLAAPPDTSTAPPRVAPHWDSDLQELRVNGAVVKQFKVPAPNQEMVLAAFEEEHWPPRIDDPLPPQADQDPKRRLHDTIVSLNRNHKSRLIRFMGDGSGEGVRWTTTTDDLKP